MGKTEVDEKIKNTGKVSENDRKVLRELAKRFVEIANAPEMTKRKQMWKDLHSLKPQRPMLIFEPY